MSRENTTKLIELVEEGVLDRHTVLLACLSYLSEADVADMCRLNDLFYGLEEDEDEDEGD